MLWPWNAFVSAKSYFERLLDLQENVGEWEATCATLFNGGSVVSLVVWLLCDIPSSRVPLLVTASLSVCLGTFLVITWQVAVFSDADDVSDKNSDVLYYLYSIFVTLCGMATSVASSGIVSLASMMPLSNHTMVSSPTKTSMIGSYFAGQAVGGLVVAIGNWVAEYYNNTDTMAFHSSTKEGTKTASAAISSWPIFWYFAGSCIVLCSCLLGYMFMLKSTPSTVWQRQLLKQPSFYKELSPLLVFEPTSSDSETSSLMSSGKDHPQNFNSIRSAVQGQPLSFDDSLDSEPDSVEEKAKDKSVYIIMWKTALALFLTYVITLVLFPVWTSELVATSTANDTSNARITPTATMYTPWTFVIFNLGDLAGRIGASYVDLNKTHDRWILVASLWRFLFLGLLGVCPSTLDRIPKSGYSLTPWSWWWDVYSWTMQAALAISNGYLTTLCFELGPTIALSSSQSVAAAALLNLSMSLGLWCGSALAMPYIYLLEWML